MTGIKYEFKANPWQYVGPSSWVFISLPIGKAKETLSRIIEVGQIQEIKHIQITEIYEAEEIILDADDYIDIEFIEIDE